MNEEFIIRRATIEDLNFLTDTIVAAEKSGTDNFGLAKFFELSDNEMWQYIRAMLNEEIEGCELSISSFLVAEYHNMVVSAFAGWVEAQNEEGLPSAILKSNIVGFCLPAENVKNSQSKRDVVRPLQIEREAGTYQLEYSYTLPQYRGYGILGLLMDAHEKEAISKGVKKMQVHVFDNNLAAIKSYRKKGFIEVKRYISEHPETSLFFPSKVELLMEKIL